MVVTSTASRAQLRSLASAASAHFYCFCCCVFLCHQSARSSRRSSVTSSSHGRSSRRSGGTSSRSTETETVRHSFSRPPFHSQQPRKRKSASGRMEPLPPSLLLLPLLLPALSPASAASSSEADAHSGGADGGGNGGPWIPDARLRAYAEDRRRVPLKTYEVHRARGERKTGGGGVHSLFSGIWGFKLFVWRIGEASRGRLFFSRLRLRM